LAKVESGEEGGAKVGRFEGRESVEAVGSDLVLGVMAF
jgi:hypothetical protein